MSAEIINLRRRRKTGERVDQAEVAAANRAKFGRTAADKQGQAAAGTQAARRLDGHRLEPSRPGDDA